MNDDMIRIVMAVSILVGIAECFFGYKLFKVFLGIVGFAIGAVLAGSVGYAVAKNELVALLAAVVGGGIAATLMVWLYYLGVFVFGALLGAMAASAGFAACGAQPVPVVLILAAVAAGVIALFLQKLLIILATSYGGAMNVVGGVAFFLGAYRPKSPDDIPGLKGPHSYAILGAWFVLGTLGFIVQYWVFPKKEEDRKDKVDRGPSEAAANDD